MGTISQDGNAPMNTLKPQPGQTNDYAPKFHPLPGDWAKQQLSRNNAVYKENTSRKQANYTEIQRALDAERAQHEYWEEWQGVKPDKAVYENPRELQNTLLPSAKYGTEGRGYG
ncbi:MAG: hypothetical protein LLF94_05660 [Chlamydiales bacterium]|nr:hypothetical protein [Chlamydiales bacterium]